MRTHRSILNFVTVALFTLATTLTALFTTPLLVRYLGRAQFGAFRMINDLYGYLTLLDLGLGGALSPLLARALGQGDTHSLRRTLAAGARAYLRVMLSALAVGLLMMPLVVRLAGLRTPELLGDLKLAWVVMLLSYLPVGLAPLRTLAEARQRGHWVNLLMTAQCLLITALSVGFALAGWGITGQACAFTLGITGFFVMLAWDAHRQSPGLLSTALLTRPDQEVRRAIWGLSLPSLMISVSGRVGLLSDNLVAGGILGPAMVTSLYVTVRLAGLAQGQLQAIGNASWAGLAELHAQGDRETFNRRLVELTTLVTFLGLAALGPIAAYSHHFVQLWVPGVFAGEPVVLVACTNALLLSLFNLWGWCFSGTGQVRRIVAPSIVATAVNLMASVLLTWKLGVIGPVLGTLVANLTITLWWLPGLYRRSFGVSPATLIGAVARPLAWGLAYGAGLWWLAHRHQPWGWAGLIAEMGTAALGFIALGSAVILSPTDRTLWRLRLAGLWAATWGARPGRRSAEAPAPAASPTSGPARLGDESANGLHDESESLVTHPGGVDPHDDDRPSR